MSLSSPSTSYLTKKKKMSIFDVLSGELLAIMVASLSEMSNGIGGLAEYLISWKVSSPTACHFAKEVWMYFST